MYCNKVEALLIKINQLSISQLINAVLLILYTKDCRSIWTLPSPTTSLTPKQLGGPLHLPTNSPAKRGLF